MAFEARYKGECVACDEPIVPKQEVEYDWDRNLRHVICPESKSGGAPRPVCPSCFLELPLSGVCECRE